MTPELRTEGVKELRIASVAVACLLLSACAGAPAATVSAKTETERQAEATRSVLADSVVSARAYGQAHLGHFLRLDPKRLQREGLEVPARISVKVKTTHTSFCITVVNRSLPSIHPWATGTVASGSPRPSSDNRCEQR